MDCWLVLCAIQCAAVLLNTFFRYGLLEAVRAANKAERRLAAGIPLKVQEERSARKHEMRLFNNFMINCL